MHQALKQGLVDDTDTALIFYDPAELASQVHRVRLAFPPNSIHAIAVKTNPLTCVLREAARLRLTAEAASFEEMLLAQHAGFGSRLIWDSPAKTTTEIRRSAAMDPLLVNLNSLDELERYEGLPHVRLGLRINPEVQPDAIPALSVGQRSSKFGVPISRREDITASCINDSRIGALHVHSSSGSRSLEPLVDGVVRTVELAEEINRRCVAAGMDRRIVLIDIGGGLPMKIPENRDLQVERYAAMLRARCPELFSGRYQILTEFGRYYHYTAGWSASRIDSVQMDRVVPNVIIHVGADSFVREVYDSDNWKLAFRLASGARSVGDVSTYRVCGPLCFEGDVIGDHVELPNPCAGDWLIALNTGANTYALWSRHCSRAFPKVILADSALKTVRVAKRRESAEDILRFWS